MRSLHSHRAATILRCLLVTAAWQAPLPFLHCHGTLATSTDTAAPWLAEHLRTHHADVDPCSPHLFGWHLHFGVPESDDAPADAPAPRRCHLVVATVFASGHADGGLAGTTADGTREVAWLVSPSLSSDAASAIRRGRVDADRAPPVPLTLRHCSLRC